MSESKDPLFIHLNSMIDNDTRMKLQLLATVRGVKLDKLVREQLMRMAEEITVEDLCLEVETAPPVERAAASTPTPVKKRATYTKHTKRRSCPVCGKRCWPQGLRVHVMSCCTKRGIEFIGAGAEHLADYQRALELSARLHRGMDTEQTGELT